MRKKYSQQSNRKTVFILCAAGVILLALIGAGVWWLTLRDNTPIETTTEPAQAPLFTFTETVDWSKGPGNKTSQVLFGKKDDLGMSSCFVSVEYQEDVIDIESKLQENQDILSKNHQVATLETKELTMKTPEGEKPYSLHQSKITSADGSYDKTGPKGGNQLGFIQLTDGYIKVLGNCDTAEELPETIAALNSVTMTATK